MKQKKVVVGLSGGVDSSVAVALLLEQGYEVVGIFMRNWNDESVVINNECPWIDDSNDALLVAEKLGIPFQVIDFSEIYKERIVDYMFREYERGRTPNPDILCNREIKFDIFLNQAIKLGADFVATGHYVQKSETTDTHGNKVFQLLAGADQGKDQSYFLCQLSQAQLAKALFPIGHLQKSEVREIAKKYDLITAEKKDSQGLCFIGKVRLPTFLQQQLKVKKGKIIEIENNPDFFKYKDDSLDELSKEWDYSKVLGKYVGWHNGIQFYTIGQRKGLHIGGTGEPLFVIGKDEAKNILYVGKGEAHLGLLRRGVFVAHENEHWIREDLRPQIGENRRVLARFRYRQPTENATIYRTDKGIYTLFDEPQKAVASGQFVAWYLENELIGSGEMD